MLFPALLIAHIILVMAGYVGLIATNTWLLALTRSGEGQTVLSGVVTWRRMARMWGPMLGAGVLVGFWLAAVSGVPLTAKWLLIVYALIVLALGAQAAIMVPWQLRAQALLARGESLSVTPVAAVIAVFSLVYIAITSLMVVRPL